MFRQILKLRQARRAFKEGRYREALRMADDEEIREHLKAEKLRKACVEALEERGEKRERAGELTGAAADFERVAEHDRSGDAERREQEIREKKKERDDVVGRARARFFRAQIEAERGDLVAARDLLRSVDEDRRTAEMQDLQRDLEHRIEAAADHLERARAVLASDPARAEELLDEAARRHPKARELRACWIDLAKAKARIACRGDLSDGALAAFLLDWGLFKRRHLDGPADSELASLDRELAELLYGRARAHVEAGRTKAAARILDRQRQVLAADQRLEEMHGGLAALRFAEEALERGDPEGARERLDDAQARLGRVSPLKALRKRLDEMRKTVEPGLAKAEDLFRAGSLEQARRTLFDVLQRAPQHHDGRRLLERINERIADHEQRIDEARRLTGAGRFERARDVLGALRDERCESAEVSLLLKEIGIRETDGTKDAAEAPPPAAKEPPPAPRPAGPGPGGEVGPAWMLSVEEHGEFLVLERDRLVLGNAVAGVADLPVLASMAARHAEIERRISFHGGVSYRIRALDGKSVLIDERRVDDAELADGDVVQLGRDFRFTFRYPSARSRAALLEMPSSFEVEGTSRVILMPPCGRAGAILVGGGGDTHVPTDGTEGELEIFRDKAEEGAALVAQGPAGVSVDGDAARAKAHCHDGSYLAACDLRATLSAVRLGT